MGYEDLKGQNDWVLKKSPLTIYYDNICHFKLILLPYTCTEAHISIKH